MEFRALSSVTASALVAFALLLGGCGCCDDDCGTDAVADLSLTKIVSDDAPNLGDTVTFTVTLTNTGPNVATHVVVLDLLPTGLMFVSAVPSQGTYDEVAGVWDVGDVLVNAPLTLIVEATVESPDPQTNTATIGGAKQGDPNIGNNTASATVIPPPGANLSLSKSVDNATPNVGDTIAFTVTLSNSGPNEATGVQVLDLLPPGLTFFAATPSQGSYDSSSGIWDVGTLASGASSTLVIQCTVVSANSLTNSAAIESVDQFDPDTSDNMASATETPQLADLLINKVADDPTPFVEDNVIFTITVTNAGPDTATGVVVQDLLPPGLLYLSAAPSQGSYVSGTGVWTVGSLAYGASAVLTLTANVGDTLALTNTATIIGADQFDPETSNNTVIVTILPEED